MEIDLTKKSKELKDFVSQFETTMFLGDISSLMQFIRFNNPMPSLQGLSSPQRQLLYLAGLNITSSIKEQSELKAKFSDKDFEHMKKLLNEVEEGYDQYFYPKPDDVIDEDWKLKRMIAMPTFLSYFNQGELNFEEQIIERIEEYYIPFNQEIVDHFNLSVSDFIDIYNFIDEVPNNFLMDKINKKAGQQTWEEFCLEMKAKNIFPWEMQEHLPEHMLNFFEWMDDKGKMNRFTRQSLIDRFGKIKTDSFLATFTCERCNTNFLYYTEKNLILSKPIFKISEQEYQFLGAHQIIQAIYNRLLEYCISQVDIKEKLYSLRGKKLEEKTEKIFRRFFRNKCFVHKGYFTQDGHEQDLLFLADGLALIIEAKASKRDEPKREPDRAYPQIVSNFNETIQKGYDQSYRVKSKFLNGETLQIFKDDELQVPIVNIKTKNYHNAFSIIVTQDRFGQIQTDLSGLLEVYDDDEYPWSVCIDDLEAFLLLLEKMEKKKVDLTQFLLIREKLHGRLITADELEVCGAFITNKINIKHVNNPNNVFPLTPNLTDIFDHMYLKKGLGFEKEKNLDLKTSGNYIPIGGI